MESREEDTSLLVLGNEELLGFKDLPSSVEDSYVAFDLFYFIFYNLRAVPAAVKMFQAG